MRLDEIGFYSLTDKRAMNANAHSGMQRCEMIITEYCNFNCPYCNGLDKRVFGNRVRREMTLGEIMRCIDLWCEGEPLKNIRFSGGEPTLHPDIVAIVEYAKFKGIERIAISTNGFNDTELYQRLLSAGVNDFSISLDSADADTGDIMAGNIKGAWDRVVHNIKYLSRLTYVTLGIVLTPENIDEFIELIEFASGLGVSDIRVISASQWNGFLEGLAAIPQEILAKHPILAYRINNFVSGRNVRGIKAPDASVCPLVLDDSVVAGEDHYPCVIYMREGGKPIGKVCANMREKRRCWFIENDTYVNPICRESCLDVCIDYNNKCMDRGIIA